EAPHAFTVNRWEQGVVFLGPGYRRKLSKLFGKSLEELSLVRRSAPSLQASLPDGPSGPIFDPVLPVYLARQHIIVGREALAREVSAQLQDPSCRHLALSGLPGVGKTTLAVSLATRSQLTQRFVRTGTRHPIVGPFPLV